MIKKIGFVSCFVLVFSFAGLSQDSARIEMPNIFTPNNDGLNDVFRPTFSGIKSANGFIYNRWGQIIYQWFGLKGYWDGVTLPAGVEVPSGTYFYVVKGITLEDKEIETSGMVTLMR